MRSDSVGLNNCLKKKNCKEKTNFGGYLFLGALLR